MPTTLPAAMPSCHCGEYSSIGCGFNGDSALYLCSRHWRVFQRRREKVVKLEYGNDHGFTHLAELDTARRVLMALGRKDPCSR